MSFHLGFCGVLQEELNLIPRLSILQHYLTGEGSHRHLSSSIKLSGQLESKAELPRHTCKAIIIEKLPSGIFADPFELQHLLQRGGRLHYFFLCLEDVMITVVIFMVYDTCTL